MFGFWKDKEKVILYSEFKDKYLPAYSMGKYGDDGKDYYQIRWDEKGYDSIEDITKTKGMSEWNEDCKLININKDWNGRIGS